MERAVNRYLQGVPLARGRRVFEAVARWVAPSRTAWRLTLVATTCLLFVAMLHAIGASAAFDGAAMYATALKVFMLGLLGVAALAAAWAAAERARLPEAPDAATEFAAARERLVRGEVEHAVALVQKVLALPIDAASRALSLGTLGDCAELRGDFAEAAEIFALALAELDARAASWRGRAFFQVVFVAKRAFALAALGRLDDAEAELRERASAPPPDLQPLVGRARALLLAKRGAHGELLDVSRACAFEDSTVIGARSKALLRVLEAHATGTIVGAYRVSAAECEMDPEMREWIASAAPHA